jgi:hypothetical protein
LLSNNKYSDVTVNFGDESLKLHKNILASSSDLFSELVKDKSTVDLDEKNSKIMKKYIEFLYTGAVDVAKDKEDELFDFLVVALKVKIFILKI